MSPSHAFTRVWCLFHVFPSSSDWFFELCSLAFAVISLRDYLFNAQLRSALILCSFSLVEHFFGN